MRTFLTLTILSTQCYMAYVTLILTTQATDLFLSKRRFRAYIDASRNGLVRYQLPLVGAIADQWLEEE